MRPLPYPHARANRRTVRRSEARRIITSLLAVAAMSVALPAIDYATQGVVARGVTAALAVLGGWV